MRSSDSCQGPLLYGTSGLWDGHSSRSEEAYIPTEYFLKNCFWYKMNAEKTWGGE